MGGVSGQRGTQTRFFTFLLFCETHYLVWEIISVSERRMKNFIVKIIDNVFEKNDEGGLFPLRVGQGLGVRVGWVRVRVGLGLSVRAAAFGERLPPPAGVDTINQSPAAKQRPACTATLQTPPG